MLNGNGLVGSIFGRGIGGLWAGVVLTTISASAEAQVSQLDGVTLPQPVGQQELGLMDSRGLPRSAMTLEGLFAFRSESIDPVADARQQPALFSPLCGFTGQLVMRGGGCMLSFGWYNEGDPDNIYELVPANVAQFGCDMNNDPECICKDRDFCPLAATEDKWGNQVFRDTIKFTAQNVKTDPRYTGGLIGFAIVGDASTDCKATKFSQPELNAMSSKYGEPWVTTLIYRSTIDPEGFYIAFEDLAMSPANWRESGSQYQNDGDFNDFVYFISGLNCEGGGQPCQTGLLGACANGVTDCDVNGNVICRADVQPGPEACDNADNDCNGFVDDGELCAAGQVCVQGTCQGSCSTGEFPCDAGLTCDNGYCVDSACAGVECPAGHSCRGGDCVDACTAVSCPVGQECQLGQCIDQCAGVECADGFVCEEGVCVRTCDCRVCPAPRTACAPDGRCIDPLCVDHPGCPAEQTCVAGECVARCPEGTTFVGGQCIGPGGPSGTGTDVRINPTATKTNSGVAPQAPASRMGCGCRAVSERTAGGAAALAGLALLGVAFARRRHE